ncbi:hypothetical protein ACHAW5_006645 [Stephanodiscus triporus]|uniref:CCHC-type domain-containing protein n=1 Tax=Stephanodiscus triporus TaxID=2934178 RepID=A0ABD3N6A3_9STRA
MRFVDFFVAVAILLPKADSLSIGVNFLSKRRSQRVNVLAQSITAVGDNRSSEGGAFASNTRYGRSNEPVDDGSKWRIWSVIKELETNGLSWSSSSLGSDLTAGVLSDDSQVVDLTNHVIRILRQWGESWAGQSGWHTLLNKKSLLHEVEESIVALHFLLDWLGRRCKQNDTPIILVDVCCGKGILSMLASYLFRGTTSTHVSRIIMLDNQKDINWSHIIASNESAQGECRPIIQTWSRCNLHDIDQIVERLEGTYDGSIHSINGPVALIGIHLCKLLSPACIGIANSLGPEKCPFLCLAPCCLPRVVRDLSKSNNGIIIPKKSKIKYGEEGSLLPVRTYESAEERQQRKEANQRRDDAKKRTCTDAPCYLCSEMHPIHKCGLLPPDENERLDIFQRVAAANPCWKCGEIGHFRKDCPSTELAAKPRLTLPPTMYLDVSSLLQKDDDDKEIEDTEHKSRGPFEGYCHLLGTALQRDTVKVIDVGLINSSAQHNNAANRDNWNRDRKSILIVASASR